MVMPSKKALFVAGVILVLVLLAEPSPGIAAPTPQRPIQGTGGEVKPITNGGTSRPPPIGGVVETVSSRRPSRRPPMEATP